MTRREGSATDPLWYKDAVIYELHVRGFLDANQDGVGDFQGLIQKLDYLQDLGVTCLWLLPFFPSPLRDDGYDISDYTSVHPDYGTLDDFKAFLGAAHERGMQVMIELVINHTSDQHPWFQAARRAPPGSPERAFYVWSETKRKYEGTRVIFTDSHSSNWSWDPEAGAYYWHRFFSHQPDLNYDNPAVVEEVLRIMRFWLDLGVDALRLDAIPYLIEREGTNCENLPETHTVIKRIRRELEREYQGRMLLAEANQWPADVRAYFGEEDECHMAFHFPLMPRLFMAIRLEDRHPVVDVMARTPPIPESCQWGLFLRNHDELTLEMVTDEERDYMYLAYSADPRMRLNLGIRRRLAPLLENDRARIELMQSILYTFPGTPIIYYGDEIGMGDNIYLGDRHGVRTPMQWSADRNAGFSRANPARLYSPVIMDPVYGYEAVNVEAQQGEPSSPLNWSRHMIALRKLFKVFGRGTIEFLEPSNRKILAYLRRYHGEQVLCVANLSRFAQPFELDLAGLAGITPVEMRGYVEFPRIGRAAYPLTLGPYGFLSFELHGEPESVESPATAMAAPVLILEGGPPWAGLFAPGPLALLESRLIREFLPSQRWFDGRGRRIESCRVEDWVALGDRAGLVVARVRYGDGSEESCFLPLAITMGAEADRIRELHPGAVLGVVSRLSETGVLHDGLVADEVCRALLALARDGATVRGHWGALGGETTDTLRETPAPEAGWPVTRLGGDQRNSSLLYGDQFVLKLFRRVETGPNPDCELTRYLTLQQSFTGVPAFAGGLEYRPAERAPAALALVQRLVANQGDGWTWMQDELARYYERAVTRSPGAVGLAVPEAWFDLDERGLTPELDELLGISDDAAGALGRQTAALHLALASPAGDPAIRAEPVTVEHLHAMAAGIRARANAALERLKEALPRLADELVEPASRLLAERRQIAARIAQLAELPPDSLLIRIHGDYHLGQVLRVGLDFVLQDFEGEPGRPLAERRGRHPALRDVASMLRSFSYAARVAAQAHVARRPGDPERLEPWVVAWERSVSAVFLDAYRRTAAGSAILPGSRQDLERLLGILVLDKALYELRYELEHRPGWVRIPLLGILDLLNRPR